jgi:hypothetical protein
MLEKRTDIEKAVRLAREQREKLKKNKSNFPMYAPSGFICE